MRWQGYQSFYNVSLPGATTQVTWERLMDPGEPVHRTMAFLDDQPAGIVHWIFHRSTWTVGDYCYLQDLFVSAEARNHGIGRALVEHVYAAAESAAGSRVYWLTHESNAVAIRLYDQLADRSGFIQYRKTLRQP